MDSVESIVIVHGYPELVQFTLEDWKMSIEYMEWQDIVHGQSPLFIQSDLVKN